MKKKFGFTLIEIMVVVFIIGLLASIVTVAVSNSRTKARDSRRKADLDTIRTALELYANEVGHYPYTTGWVYSCNSTWDSLATLLAPYLSTLPKDPINKRISDGGCGGPWVNGYYVYSYGYTPANYPGKYDLVAQLENTNDNDRCAVKNWKYHTAGSDGIWCVTWTYSQYLYADH